jgi:hypothetical protein
MSDDRKYGLASLIHVLGGLPLRGCAYLLYGKPGIGKSALAFGVLCELGQGGICGHYISSEQSAIDLVRMAYRAKVPKKASILIQSACGMQDIATAIDGRKSAVYVVDSIHSITDASALDVAATLSRLAMDKDVVIFAIAHTNAAGGLDGGDRLREPFAKVLRLRAHGEAADPHRILETEATPRRLALRGSPDSGEEDCGSSKVKRVMIRPGSCASRRPPAFLCDTGPAPRLQRVRPALRHNDAQDSEDRPLLSPGLAR